MTPTATYRIQLQPEFPFAAARETVPYLAGLGVSHLHLSPVLEAVPGSTHGYDVTDHSRIRAELGGEDGLRALAATAREHGLGLIADIVPNHMAVPAPESLNRPLWEVLRDGAESPYARWFDIDWTRHGGRLLLPVLGGRLGDELGRLRTADGTLRYGDHRLPLRPGTESLPLPELLDAQHYRLAWWRLARTELNYRRFFTISELIALRVEDPEVFAATHGKVLQLLREGVLEGLRVDHPDGLTDPETYFARLHEATGGAWTVAEKILTGDETLSRDWKVAGTTGYEALRHIDGLFVDPGGHAELTAHYADFTAAPADRGGDWPATVRRAARGMLAQDLAAEVGRLARTAARICAAGPPALRDHAPWALAEAIREVLVRLPVYRPYVRPGEKPSAADVAMLQEAAEGARSAFAVPAEADAVEVVRDAALGRLDSADGCTDARDFCARFAQTAAALRAKAVEDRACYRYPPLLSACEVGGEPGDPAIPVAAFHAFCVRRQREWPEAGTVLSTHDTKRSADTRAAIAALTQHPRRWRDFLAAREAATPAPDRHTAWWAWQTALGLGFPYDDRLKESLLKAAREARLRTGWTEPDEAYERALADFTEAGPQGPGLYATAQLADELAETTRANILGAALLHLTMPGVPDLYQRTEAEYRALVDPDNRAPLLGHPAEDAKLRLTRLALRLRREHPEWFGRAGSYEPVHAEGPAADHVVAFARAGRAVTVVTRLAAAGGWRGTRLVLPAGTWRDALGGGEHTGSASVAEVLAERPVALLVRE
ncbi:malto-oligosyltrehalose synthase [Streptomyces sp. A7024]|uniref:Malto-oligosyltrehalose synthase n=1 Tax=Streptomyces coryli TaxID=1128680 RepID=A0A6G4U4U5_9ACTN|nr:malto-oligosyltrehalose synthase [Streptomyces coryli]NGN66231.1 malto-oligosyltrehalose synthase [Streptomyces coryli]